MLCNQCPRKCNIDRTSGNRGFCGVDDRFFIARAALHAWEEPPISGKNGSGTIFFSGCNLRCVFCQNHDVSHNALGKYYSDEELYETMLRLQEEGAHNINLVTPSHYTLRLTNVLEKIKPRISIPVVWNSSAYETKDTLRRLDGLVDIYLPDCKYYSPELSTAYSAAPDYFEVALSAISEMVRQTGAPRFDKTNQILQSGTIIRHLVLPGCRKDSITMLQEIGKHFSTEEVLLSLMCQYTPDFALNCHYQNLHRKLTTFEYQSVLDVAEKLGFRGFSQDPSSATAAYTPSFLGE